MLDDTIRPSCRADFRKIRKDFSVPDWITEGFGRKVPISIVGQNGVNLNYVVGRWGNDSHSEYKDIMHREVLCLFVKEGKPVGYAAFTEWRVDEGMREQNFVWGMDEISGPAVNMSLALMRSWTIERLAPDGRFVEFTELKTNDGAISQQWPTLIKLLLKRRYGFECSSRSHVLVLKPFPLEYSDMMQNKESARMLDHRIQAMQRLYGKALGAHPILDEQWMWVPLSRYAQRPRKRKFELR